MAFKIDPPVLILSAHLSAEHEQVILMESAEKIRRLVLRDGHRIRSVSRDTGLSRNTIRKYVHDASPPGYHRSGPPVLHKLAGFEDRLKVMFEQDLKRPRRERRTVVKLYEQLVQEGYTGSCSPVYRFVRALKDTGSQLSRAFMVWRKVRKSCWQCAPLPIW